MLRGCESTTQNEYHLAVIRPVRRGSGTPLLTRRGLVPHQPFPRCTGTAWDSCQAHAVCAGAGIKLDAVLTFLGAVSVSHSGGPTPTLHPHPRLGSLMELHSGGSETSEVAFRKSQGWLSGLEQSFFIIGSPPSPPHFLSSETIFIFKLSLHMMI